MYCVRVALSLGSETESVLEANYLVSQALNFLICKMGTMVILVELESMQAKYLRNLPSM